MKGIQNAKNHYFSSLNPNVVGCYSNMAVQYELGICAKRRSGLAVLDSGNPVDYGQNLRLESRLKVKSIQLILVGICLLLNKG